MSRNASCVQRKAPVRFVSSTARQSSNATSSRVVGGALTPALLKRRSSRPNRASTSAKRAATDAGSRTSQVSGDGAAARARGGGLQGLEATPGETTVKPAPASATAAARPIPLPAPVTSGDLWIWIATHCQNPRIWRAIVTLPPMPGGAIRRAVAVPISVRDPRWEGLRRLVEGSESLCGVNAGRSGDRAA